MTYLEALIAERTSRTSVWIEFSTTYRQSARHIYVFFEGRDDFSYYMPELRRTWQDGDIYSFECRGKDGVLSIVPTVVARLDHAWRGLFFVDKDIDDLLLIAKSTHPFVYETEYYSIENYLVCDAVLRMVWTDLFGLSIADKRLPHAISQFQASWRLFCNLMIPVMATIWELRKMSEKLNLKEFKHKSVISVDEALEPHLDLNWYAEFKRWCKFTKDPDPAKIKENEDVLAKRDVKTYIRGKFEIWFFAEFLKRLDGAINTARGDAEKVHTRTKPWNEPVEVLAGRLLPPHSLTVFLDQWKTAMQAKAS